MSAELVSPRGYLKRPDLSAERFIRIHSPTQARIENVQVGRSRALSRERRHRVPRPRRPTGEIRGFRVELGEIEAALAEHAGVRPDGRGGAQGRRR